MEFGDLTLLQILRFAPSVVHLRVWLWYVVMNIFAGHVYLGSSRVPLLGCPYLSLDWESFQLSFHFIDFLCNHFSFFLGDFHNLNICSFNEIPNASAAVFILFFLFFLSDWDILSDLSSSSDSLSADQSNPLLRLSTIIFTRLIEFFTSKHFVWFLFKISITLLNFLFI